MAFWSWSRTAASNASADSTINYAEGQAPSSLNDSARAAMARLAEYRDDISGAIVTGGTATAYTVTSYQVFDTLAHLNGQMIAFTPHTTNAATVTLNVDGLGAKPLRSAPSVELLAGTIIQGTPYVATYNNSDAAFYLQGFYGSNYLIPLAASINYWAPTAPNSSFAFPAGQAISRTTYASLFSLFSTTYGTGDGSTTFNLPDVRGRVIAALDNLNGSAASRITAGASGIASTSLGGTGGAQTIIIGTSNLPPYTPTGTVATSVAVQGQFINNGVVTGSATIFNAGSTTAAASATSTFTGTAQGGSSTAIVTLPPLIMGGMIMRII